MTIKIYFLLWQIRLKNTVTLEQLIKFFHCDEHQDLYNYETYMFIYKNYLSGSADKGFSLNHAGKAITDTVLVDWLKFIIPIIISIIALIRTF